MYAKEILKTITLNWEGKKNSKGGKFSIFRSGKTITFVVCDVMYILYLKQQ